MPPLRRLTLTALTAGLAGAAGCNSITDTGTTATAQTGVRFVQVVNDASSVAITANGTALGSINFGQAASIVLPALPSLSFTANGATTPFVSQSFATLTANNYFTVITLGNVTSGVAPAATVAVLADTSAYSSTQLLVRVFNAVDYLPTTAGGDPVDVYLYPQGAARPTTPTVAGLAWNARSAYIPLTGGNLQADVFPAGAASTGTPVFSTPFTASEGSVRTLVLRDPPAGSVAGTTGTVLVLADVN